LTCFHVVHSSKLPEVVQLTADREEWRGVVTGLNSSQGP